MVKFVAIWNGNIPDIVKLCLQSFIYINHNHTLDVYILDSDNIQLFQDEYKDTNVNFIILKNFEEIIDNSIYNKYKTKKIANHLPFNSQENLAYRADIFRTIMLQKSTDPTCYIDLDICFLKSMDTLFEKHDSFCYEWDKHREPFCVNTAILYSNGSSKIRNIFHNILLHSDPYPLIGFSYKNPYIQNITILDKSLFDMFWCGDNSIICKYIMDQLGERNFDIFFKTHPNSQTVANYMKENCYIYHWHNHWKSTISINSIAYWLSKDVGLQI